MELEVFFLPQNQQSNATGGKGASGAPFANDDLDIGVDFGGEDDYFWQNDPSNSAPPTIPPEAPPMPPPPSTMPANKEAKSPSKVVVIKKPKASTALAKKNLRPFPCVMEGCKFAARYAKDLERHARTHTGKCFYCTVYLELI